MRTGTVGDNTYGAGRVLAPYRFDYVPSVYVPNSFEVIDPRGGSMLESIDNYFRLPTTHFDHGAWSMAPEPGLSLDLVHSLIRIIRIRFPAFVYYLALNDNTRTYVRS